MNFKKGKGFTLVEALVVVILIAIGAALAFSFYDQVVVEGREKAAAAYAIDSARTIGEAAGAYYLRTGTPVTDVNQLVTSGDLKAIPDPSRLLAKTEIPMLLATAHAEGSSLEFVIGLDNNYKLDGTPEGIDGYVDIAGITNEGICGKINEELKDGTGGGIVRDTETRVAATPVCSSGTLDNGTCKTAPTCSSGTYNSATKKCEVTQLTNPTAAVAYINAVATYSKPVYSYNIDSSDLSDTNPGGWMTYGYMSPSPFTGSVPVYKNTTTGYLQSNASGGVIFGYVAPNPAGLPGNQTILALSGNYFQDKKNFVSHSSYGGNMRVGNKIYHARLGFLSSQNGTFGGTEYTCGYGKTLSGTTCYASTTTQTAPTCASGSFDEATDSCLSTPTPPCGSGLLDAGTGECVIPATCPGRSDADDKCLTAGSYCYDAGDGTYTFHYPFAVQ